MTTAIKRTLIAGIVCTVGAPLVGLFFTALGMLGAFRDLGEKGISDPSVLARHIAQVLVATEIGLVVGFLGLPVIIVALVLHFNRRPAPPQPNP